MEFDTLFRLVDMMNLIVILVHSFVKGKNPIYVISYIKKKKPTKNLQVFNVIGLYEDILRLFSFKLGYIGMIKTSEPYILALVWIISMLVQGHSCMRN